MAARRRVERAARRDEGRPGPLAGGWCRGWPAAAVGGALGWPAERDWWPA